VASTKAAPTDRFLKGAIDGGPIHRPRRRPARLGQSGARRTGIPTAHPQALDADCILAAQATLLGGPGDIVTIASRNVRHLARFPGVDARPWESIAP
jgi:hypothetical protein